MPAKDAKSVTTMVTANRLTDGVVVFLTADGRWSERFADGAVAEGKDAGAARLAEAERSVADCTVVGPYLIDVVADGAAVRPVRYRETIRVLGPTVAADFRVQAGLRG